MKMTVVINDRNSPDMLLEHNEQSLIFDLSVFNKNHITVVNDITEHINAYWASLAAYKQEKIYETYVKIRNTFEDIYDTSQLCIALMPLVKQLYSEHDLEALERYLAFHTDIKIPDKFDETYVHSDERPFSREKTYTRPDYMKLASLTLSLRIMIPVWGEFIFRTKAENGTNFKEYYAYTLLSQTKLLESPAVEKLKLYISNNLQAEKSMSSVIMNGVSSDDYVTWKLGGLLVKRLSVGDIKGVEPNTNLVITIHNDLMTKNNNSNGNFGDPVLNKVFDSENGDDMSMSRIENFKLKAEHSVGDIEAIAYYVEDIRKVARHLYPTIDVGLLHEFKNSSNILGSAELWSCQITLAQWVLAPVVSPRGAPHLEKLSIIDSIVVAQTYLWQTGHKKLAALITAIASDVNGTMQQSSIGSMARITREQMEHLTKLFPYNTVSAKRKNTIPPNVAVKAIDIVAEQFSTRDWILTLPDRFAEEIIGSQHHRRYGCPHDIKIALAALSIDCARR